MNNQDDNGNIEKCINYLKDNFRLNYKIKVPLKELFPKPEKKHLQSFWNNGSHADIAVFRHAKLICIIELNGYYHFKDKRQITRDKKKYAICKQNNINMLSIANGILNNLNKSIVKKLFKKYFYEIN
jgi:hypothetical protein